MLFFTSLMAITSVTNAQKVKEFIYIGTYSVRGSEGIYVFEFDRTKGSFKQVQTISNLKSPSFLTFSPDGKFLYSVGESTIGAVGSFSIDPETGMLTFVNQQSSEDSGSCHISIDHAGKFAFVSNYGGGSLTVLPIEHNGSLRAASDIIHHQGSSINKERQDKPHVHSAYVSPDNRFIIVSDLGTDKIYSYELDRSTGKMKPAINVSVTPGSGPRHLVFHPDGKHIYSVEEISSTVGVLSYEKTTGTIKIIKDTVRSLPGSFTAYNKSADIHTDPKGKFLYMSNRGMDAISIFSILADGTIKLIGQQESMGKTPRNFLVDPKGEFMFVANQDSDNIAIFRIDQTTGMLAYTGNQVKVPAPVCIQMLGKP